MSNDAKECWIIFLTVVILLAVGTGMYFGIEYGMGLREASTDEYISARQYAELNPKLKDMVQDALADNILTKSEYKWLKAERTKQGCEEYDKRQEEKRQEAKAELIKAAYGKDEQ